ncbi:MAG TPA: restriction endonuclease [Thermoanaerobaculia bacterium]|nr:restriction endonuclease [Thermoanaerobaculia bacterium]
MILDYAEYIEDGKHSSPRGYSEAKNPTFFSQKRWCPFCNVPTQEVADEKEEQRVSTIDERGVMRSAQLCACGWWQTNYYEWRNDSGFEWDDYGARHAILRRYEPADSELPVATLRRALIKKPDLIHQIGKRKTEELVGSIFADYYDCDVRMVGKSSDGGFDLVLVLSDRHCLVQVKNRERNSKRWRAEPVSTVREFLGAFLLADGQNGILVTTADHFSKQAKEAAAKAITRDDVRQYDLIDGGELLRTLNLTSTRVNEHWRQNLVFAIKQ